MHDSAAPYWDRCKEMGFGELRKFIDDALTRLPEADSEPDLPGSKREFVELADLLDEKLDAQRAAAPTVPPRPPAYAGDYMFPWFEPSEQLVSTQNRLERLEYMLDEARDDPSHGASYVRQLQSEVKDLEREVELRETGEREEHEKRYASYRETSDKHARAMRSWRKEAAEVQKIHGLLGRRAEIVRRVRRDIERAFKSEAGVSTQTVQWDLLPQGSSSVETVVRRLYGGMQGRGAGTRYDHERLDKALELDPNRCYVGRDGFDGYAVFTFADTPKALMECPKVGNAIYVIHSDWEHWSKMTKQELMAEAERGGEVTRIPHQGDWYRRVREELGIR